MKPTAEAARAEILRLVEDYHGLAFQEPEFVPGVTQIPYAGRVFDQRELRSLVEASLDFWLTAGRFADEFERAFPRYFGLRHAALTNSGSSANLLALSCLTSPKL